MIILTLKSEGVNLDLTNKLDLEKKVTSIESNENGTISEIQLDSKEYETGNSRYFKFRSRGYILSNDGKLNFTKANSGTSVVSPSDSPIETTGVIFDHQAKIQAAMLQGKRVKIIRTNLPDLEIVATQETNGINKYLVDDGTGTVLGLGEGSSNTAALGRGDLSNDFYLFIENYGDADTGYVTLPITNFSNIQLIMDTIRLSGEDYGRYNSALFLEGTHLRVITSNEANNWNGWGSFGSPVNLRSQVINKVNDRTMSIIFRENVMDGKMRFVNTNIGIDNLNYSQRFATLSSGNRQYLANIGDTDFPHSYTKMVSGTNETVHTNEWYYNFDQELQIWALAHRNIRDATTNGDAFLDDSGVAWHFKYSIGTTGLLEIFEATGAGAYQRTNTVVANNSQANIIVDDFNNLSNNTNGVLSLAQVNTIIEVF